MSRFLLLILLSSWSTVVPLLASRCGPGVAYPGQTLDVPHSLVSNADVALLEAYRADDANTCTTDCCTQKFGSCTIATFSRTSRHGNNCRHFNCRPLPKCIYSSSNTTDSVSYFSPTLSSSVPSRSAFFASSAPDIHLTHDQQASGKSDPPIKSHQLISTEADQPVSGEPSQQVKNDLKQSDSTVPDQQTRSDLHQSFNIGSGIEVSDKSGQQVRHDLHQSVSTESGQNVRSDLHQQVSDLSGKHAKNYSHQTVNTSSDIGVSNGSNQRAKDNSHISTDSDYPISNKLERIVSDVLDLENGTTVIADFGEQFPSNSKPRKGVNQTVEFSESNGRKGVKPRKGVSLDHVVADNTLSNIKPRKGVGTIAQPTTTTSELQLLSTTNGHFAVSSTVNAPYDGIAYDLASALENVFGDDTTTDGSTSATITTVNDKSAAAFTFSTSSASHLSSVTSQSVSSLHIEHSSVALQSSYSSSSVFRSSASTPDLQPETAVPLYATRLKVDPSKTPSMYEHSVRLFHDASTEDAPEQRVGETEKERKYQTSMHLVLSLVFGLLVLFVVLGVVGKRVYDGWLRRHYRRMDFLIDGMYNGY